MTLAEPMRAKGPAASLTLALLLTGCRGGEQLVAPLGAEVGTYALATIGGNALAVTIAQTQSSKLEVTAASITLDADGFFRDVTDTRITTPDTSFVSSDTVQGSWLRTRNTIFFTLESDEGYQMQLGRGSLAGVKSSVTWVYAK